ncbi:MAG TPA: DUF177 domain-containing protein [Actinomycetota bacterium]
MEGVAVALARVPDQTRVVIDVRLDALVEGIHVSGQVAATIHLECRRCLATFNRDLQVEVGEVFVPRPAPSDDEYEVVEGMIDLEPMIRDVLVLAMPLNPICREGCLGLCPACGVDRNAEDCGHDTARTNVRWGALESLRRKMMEG